jgi:signal transduction histidine kinase
MSHELRTPLNAILGYTELILDSVFGEMPEKARSVLDRVQRNGRHLLGLINDVLDLSKIEAGQLTLSLSDYSLKSVIQTVFSAGSQLSSNRVSCGSTWILKFAEQRLWPTFRPTKPRSAKIASQRLGDAALSLGTIILLRRGAGVRQSDCDPQARYSTPSPLCKSGAWRRNIRRGVHKPLEAEVVHFMI